MCFVELASVLLFLAKSISLKCETESGFPFQDKTAQSCKSCNTPFGLPVDGYKEIFSVKTSSALYL